MEPTISKGQLWTGRVLSTIVVLFMLFDGIMKFMKPQIVIDSTRQLGYAEHHIAIMAFLATLSAVLYAIPRTSVLGAIILTGYLGGAIATNLRLDLSLFGNVLFPVYMGIFAWGGLWLRNLKLREIFPLTK